MICVIWEDFQGVVASFIHSTNLIKLCVSSMLGVEGIIVKTHIKDLVLEEFSFFLKK